jgi:hypothetical protein
MTIFEPNAGATMPARLSLTKAQRDAVLLLPDTEEAFVRHYSLVAEDIEIISGYRTPETRLAFALQLCVLRYPGRVLRHGEIMPMHLLAFIAEQVGSSGWLRSRSKPRTAMPCSLRSQRRCVDDASSFPALVWSSACPPKPCTLPTRLPSV